MKTYAIGVDIGGTAIKFGLFKTNKQLIDKWEVATNRKEQGGYILSQIVDEIDQILNRYDINKSKVMGIGVGVPGPVDTHGRVLKCVNLGWDVFNIEEELSRRTGLLVKAGNDANVAALGEMWQGGGEGYQNVVMVTLGTGVGGGIVIGENIVTGSNGAAGEIGHFHVCDVETSPCGCGNYGCLEQYASATGIIRIANDILERSTKNSTLRTKKLDAKIIFQKAKNQDEIANEIVDTICKLLGTTLAQIACVINPQVFVIGGGMSNAGDILIQRIQQYYQQYAFHAAKHTAIRQATLGNDAGIYGGVQYIMKYREKENI